MLKWGICEILKATGGLDFQIADATCVCPLLARWMMIAAGDIRINSSEKVVKYLVHRQESLRTNAVPVFVCRLDCERCEHRHERKRSAVGI